MLGHTRCETDGISHVERSASDSPIVKKFSFEISVYFLTNLTEMAFETTKWWIIRFCLVMSTIHCNLHAINDLANLIYLDLDS